MRTFALFTFAGFVSVAASGASAQQPMPAPIDCGNPQNALTVYCNSRAAPMVVAPAPGVIIDVPTTGSVITGGQGLGGTDVDCGNPQNALTTYCNNRDQFSR